MKRFLVGLLILLIIVGGGLIAVFFGTGYYLSPQDPLSKADAIVAISGGDTNARAKEAVALYKEGWARHIIFSGAALDTSGPSNAQAMARLAEASGVPSDAIELDEEAKDTRDNAAKVAQILAGHQYRSIILVTSPYHQRRAYITFHRALGPDVTIINHSSFDAEWRRSHWWATPTSRSLTFSEVQKVIYELASGQSQ